MDGGRPIYKIDMKKFIAQEDMRCDGCFELIRVGEWIGINSLNEVFCLACKELNEEDEPTAWELKH